jgi:hypothetical protein
MTIFLTPKRKLDSTGIVDNTSNTLATLSTSTLYDYIQSSSTGGAVVAPTPSTPGNTITPVFDNEVGNWAWSEVVTEATQSVVKCAIGLKCNIGLKVC